MRHLLPFFHRLRLLTPLKGVVALPKLGWIGWAGLSGVLHVVVLQAFVGQQAEPPREIRFEQGPQVIAAVLVTPAPPPPLPEPPPEIVPEVVATHEAAVKVATPPELPPAPLPPVTAAPLPEPSPRPTEPAPVAPPVTPAVEPAPAPVAPLVTPPSPAVAKESRGAEAPAARDALLCPEPDYPRLARRRGMEGTVLLEVDVGPDGRVQRAAIASSSGHSILDHAALTTVRDLWRWPEASRSVTLTVANEFRLD